jgi:hypothetical protein
MDRWSSICEWPDAAEVVVRPSASTEHDDQTASQPGLPSHRHPGRLTSQSLFLLSWLYQLRSPFPLQRCQVDNKPRQALPPAPAPLVRVRAIPCRHESSYAAFCRQRRAARILDAGAYSRTWTCAGAAPGGSGVAGRNRDPTSRCQTAFPPCRSRPQDSIQTDSLGHADVLLRIRHIVCHLPPRQFFGRMEVLWLRSRSSVSIYAPCVASSLPTCRRSSIRPPLSRPHMNPHPRVVQCRSTCSTGRPVLRF